MSTLDCEVGFTKEVVDWVIYVGQGFELEENEPKELLNNS